MPGVKNLWRTVKAAGSGFTRVANRFQMSFLTVTTNKAGFVTTASSNFIQDYSPLYMPEPDVKKNGHLSIFLLSFFLSFWFPGLVQDCLDLSS